jgi:leucyl-tRNA synthetase
MEVHGCFNYPILKNMKYEPRIIEKKWKRWWDENRVYAVANDSTKPKYYVLDMFPYPSGSGLHVGHPLGYIASDIFARYKRMQGYNVLHPMGYDAYGLPAEQFAIQTGVHPAVSTSENIDRYREQLENLGLSFDWEREVRTCDPFYYKWTQWIFLQLYHHYYCNDTQAARPIAELKDIFETEGNVRLNAACSEDIKFTAHDWQSMSAKEKDDVLMNYRLAYRRTTYVWWCEALGTVLANDEVKDGFSERGGYPVERKPMLQWSLRITAYAERLLKDLEELDFSESMKKTQSNWIGRSEGALMFFDLADADEKLEIYTTRPDTIYGATFMVLAPEHNLVDRITTASQRTEIDEYLKYVNTRSERDRMAEVKEVTGAFTGAYALNPFNGEKIPVWIAEYVLKDYGTGAIMAVPADDERDLRFAQKYQLPIVPIIDKSMHPSATIEDKVGVMINSGFLTGMQVPDAIDAILKEIEQRKIGTRKVNYKLRDAIYSRQRYWGEPFPIVYDENGVPYALSVDELPLELPELEDFKPASGGKSPLARATNWVNLPNGWTRETDTMPGFAGSSWYFLRYMDPGNPTEFASRQALNYWQDVDLYVGGTEHAVGHLMYSRFWHKFLYDLGYVPVKEPYKKLINQGMIQGIIESIYLLKERVDGFPKFVCAHRVQEDEIEVMLKIPVLVDYVKEYGTPNSYLNLESIKQFIKWRPEYENAIFECSNGSYHKGVFQSNKSEEGKFYTVSEVGKMSKSKYNVINPDDVIEEYGADCFRMYEMFLGPIEQAKPWDTKGIDGVSKFLRKLWRLFYDEQGLSLVNDQQPDKTELKILHACIKKITDDIERFSMNTCVSGFMICVNELRSLNCSKREILEPLVKLITPFVPHMAEELWHHLGHESTVCEAEFPKVNEEYLKEDTLTYVVSINGKKRALVDLPANLPSAELEKIAMELDNIKKYVEGQTVRKVIIVPGKMVNIVVS